MLSFVDADRTPSRRFSAWADGGLFARAYNSSAARRQSDVYNVRRGCRAAICARRDRETNKEPPLDKAWIAGFRTTTRRVPFVLVALCAGCTSISIQPSCPNELTVGESGRVAANELTPGAIATYLWQVFPADAGTFDDPTLPTTTFQAANTGEVLIRLTASDGLYQVISSCVTSIVEPADVAVSLIANVTEAAVDEPITLTCTSIGASVAIDLFIVRVSGAAGTLTEVLAGTGEFRATESGVATFSCTGTDTNGEQSSPATVTVTISAGTNGGNANANDNGNGNTNDNGGGGGRR